MYQVLFPIHNAKLVHQVKQAQPHPPANPNATPFPAPTPTHPQPTVLQETARRHLSLLDLHAHHPATLATKDLELAAVSLVPSLTHSLALYALQASTNQKIQHSHPPARFAQLVGSSTPNPPTAPFALLGKFKHPAQLSMSNVKNVRLVNSLSIKARTRTHMTKNPTARSAKLEQSLPLSPPSVVHVSPANISGKMMLPWSRVNFVRKVLHSRRKQQPAPSVPMGSTKLKILWSLSRVRSVQLVSTHQPRKQLVPYAKMESFKSWRSQSSTNVNIVSLALLSL